MRLVLPNEAAGSGAQEAMTTRVVAGDSANQRTLDASLGFRYRRSEQRDDC
jgi:hypothetical protein